MTKMASVPKEMYKPNCFSGPNIFFFTIAVRGSNGVGERVSNNNKKSVVSPSFVYV